MAFADELAQRIDALLSGTYQTFTPRSVPLPEDLPVGGAKAAQFEAAMLFIDIRQSSVITEVFRLQTAAKMIRAYCDGSVRIIHRNSGSVRSFNGDGMLAVFMGDARRNNAVKAALNCVWFAHHLLRPKVERYFANNAAAKAVAGGFRIGCGIDVGTIYAVRVGIGGTNDIAWVGRPTNTAAKLAALTRYPDSIAITSQVYNQLRPAQKSSNGQSMWSKALPRLVAGGLRNIHTSRWYWRA